MITMHLEWPYNSTQFGVVHVCVSYVQICTCPGHGIVTRNSTGGSWKTRWPTIHLGLRYSNRAVIYFNETAKSSVTI